MGSKVERMALIVQTLMLIATCYSVIQQNAQVGALFTTARMGPFIFQNAI
jgi:hypothetical protein